MTNHTWIGGGNNRADNPKDWSPTGVPQPSDATFISQGTIRIDQDLGDNPALPGIPGGNNPLWVEGNVTIEVSKAAQVFPLVNFGHATINVRDNPHMLVVVDNGQSATVDLAANSQWIGNFGAGTFWEFAQSNASLIVNGGPHSSLLNEAPQGGGSGVSGAGALAVVNVDVTGTGITSAFDGGKLEFGQSVGLNQTVFLVANAITNEPPRPGGVLQIDQPNQFLGQVQLAIGEIDLMGLATADSYSYQNDMLSLYAGGKVIDTLNLHQLIEGTAPLPFDVERTQGGVSIFTVGNQTSPPLGTLLPLHV